MRVHPDTVRRMAERQIHAHLVIHRIWTSFRKCRANRRCLWEWHEADGQRNPHRR